MIPLNLKRIVSIFLLAVFLFNLGGYHLVFWGMQRSAKQELLHRLDADDSAFGETMVLEVPLSLPYPLHSEGFQRANGDFEFQGEFYKVIKQKWEKDVLYIVCLKDSKAKEISTAHADYSKLVNDMPAGTKQALNFFGKLFKDYTRTESLVDDRQDALLSELTFIDPVYSLSGRNYSVDSPPPELLS